MDINTALRFLHIIFGALLLGQTLEDWLWARSWPGQPRQDLLKQFRRQGQEEPRKVVVLFGTLISGLVLVFVKLGGAFSGWLWLSIGLSVVVIALASFVEVRAFSDTLKLLEADAVRDDFVDVQGGMGRVKWFYGLILAVWVIITFLMVFRPF